LVIFYDGKYDSTAGFIFSFYFFIFFYFINRTFIISGCHFDKNVAMFGCHDIALLNNWDGWGKFLFCRIKFYVLFA
jgi:hypothetical protein